MASSLAPYNLQNYIGGAFVPAISGAMFDDLNPATGATIATIPRSSPPDVDAAVAAAKAAFPAWSRTPSSVRADFLDAIAARIESSLHELAALESEDAGKTLKMATTVDIPRAVANFRFFAGQLRHDETSCFIMQEAINYSTRVPVGVAALITPWNLPLYLLSWKVAPALACGNAVVAKPSEITPRTASALAAIIHAVGLPHGVFNLVHGYGHEAGAALVAHKDAHLVSFTGGTVTGRAVAAIAAPMFKKLSLELGGKNATIVFADVDRAAGSAGSPEASGGGGMTFDRAVEGVVRAAFTNNGQVCLCGSRIFIQRPLYEKFLRAFVARVRALVCGDPAAVGTDVGPLSSAPHRDKVLSYITLASELGGVLECGGTARPAGVASDPDSPFFKGNFVQPTVVSGLHWSSRVAQEEIFGPVVTVHAFDTEEEVVEAANSVEYGLAGSIWTNDLSTAHRVSDRVMSGILWVNCWLLRDLRSPFGGMKASGVGREGGRHSLDFFSEWKNVCVFTGPR